MVVEAATLGASARSCRRRPHGRKAIREVSNIRIIGTDTYISDTDDVLKLLSNNGEGWLLLMALGAARYKVTIQAPPAGKGNSCSAETDSAFPLLVQAIKKKSPELFKSSLAAALRNAASRGVTLEHLARQLAMGMTPVTYKAIDNVIRPTTKTAMPPNGTAQQAMDAVTARTIKIMGWLQEFADGRLEFSRMPTAWAYDLPRLLRPYLQPGRGSNATVKFDPLNDLPCHSDPAMKNCPSAFGLAHEMIHGLHGVQGINMRVRNPQNHGLEELITTGIPPYHFEEMSDNKLRSLWGARVPIRTHY